ncbi:MAG: hypothetical protein MJZ84_07075 [Paludibacteraceae bacterium]|nr:hypothetical protein [Paludibacteraceae bacterium]
MENYSADAAVGSKKRETRNEKQETRNEKRETRNEKRETRNEYGQRPKGADEKKAVPIGERERPSSQFAWYDDKPTVRHVVPAIAPLPTKWYFAGAPKNQGRQDAPTRQRRREKTDNVVCSKN